MRKLYVFGFAALLLIVGGASFPLTNSIEHIPPSSPDGDTPPAGPTGNTLRLKADEVTGITHSLDLGLSSVVSNYRDSGEIKIDSVTIPGTAVTFTLAELPAGTFTLGSPTDEANRGDDEGPQRAITIDGFWMSTHEVTFDEYAVFRFRDRDSDEAATSSYSADAVTRPSIPYEDPAHGMGNQGFPATGMTQWAALQYAYWLSLKTGSFYRLPTEAEWEYACRAGSGDGYLFGDDATELGQYAWYFENSSEAFHKVGTKRPNDLGLYDLHGNVSEWTLDQYKMDFYANIDDGIASPWQQPTRLHPRTVRGGAFDDDADELRCSNRIESSLKWKRRDPQIPKSKWWNTDSPFLGFRLVRPVNPPAPEAIEQFWASVLAFS